MLIPVAKKQPQQEYIFTEYEKLALQLLPEEQVKSSNHEERIIDLMLEDEARDASPEHTKRDIYKALDNSKKVSMQSHFVWSLRDYISYINDNIYIITQSNIY